MSVMQTVWFWSTLTVGVFIATFVVGQLVLKARRKPAAVEDSTTTEFACEVVRIATVEKHPNADRLDVVTFEMRATGQAAYRVIVGRGDFAVGDLAAYFSVDCIVPLKNPLFEPLTAREDAKSKDFFRIRAAKIRKVYSQGLLTPVPSHPASGLRCEYGQRLADILGVTYHQTPEPGSPTTPKTGKTPNAGPAPVYGVASLKKSPDLFEPGELVFVTEKVHGMNFRFGWVPRKILGIQVGWKFFIGSHRAVKGQGTAGFYGTDVWAEYAKQNRLAERTASKKNYIFYGELFGKTYQGANIQDLTYGKELPNLVVFDILYLPGGWLPVNERRGTCYDYGFAMPPVVGDYEGEPWYPDLAADLAEGPSHIHAGTIREGVVVESMTGDPVGERRKAKFVSKAYLLRETTA